MSILEEFHTRIRLAGREDEPAPGIVFDTDGPVRRRYPATPGSSYCMVECPAGLGDDPDHWIVRQVAFFAARGEQVEWKTYSYDSPADLGARLSAAGFVAEDDETLLLGEVAGLIHDVVLPDGVTVRQVTSEEDLARIDALMTTIWGEGRGQGSLAEEMRADPDALDVVVAEESPSGPVLCAGWLRYTPGTGFASMWGGSTLPQWRRRGLYRATVSLRASLAEARGYRYMRLDTSPDSRPILERLGLQAVAITTPYVFDGRSDAIVTS